MIFVIPVLIALVSIVLLFISIKPKQVMSNEEIVTCIMVTGKDDKRMELAKESILNFHQQTYPHKRLLVLNHHPSISVADGSKSVHEFKVKKDTIINLGDLRNLSMELITDNELFIPWDDDDYRDPTYISVMYNHLYTHQADLVALTNRYEYNLQTDYVWRSHLKNGFVHVLARKQPEISYLSKDSMEDLELISSYDKQYKTVKINNDPMLYIRLVHGTNTSFYVNYQKKSVNQNYSKKSDYQEFDVDMKTRNKVINIIKHDQV